MTQPMPAASPVPKVQMILPETVLQALRLGLGDFLRAPAYGLAFAAVYVLGGWVLDYVLARTGREVWLIPFAVGFPILGPFAAVGLYEVSRRLETGEALSFGRVAGVIFRQKDRQIPAMAAVILILFLFWVFLAHMIFALFMGLSAMVNVSTDPWGVLLSQQGLMMLGFGTLVGAVFAGVLFAITVTGLPLLLERELDFVTAMIASVETVVQNPAPMALWAAIVAGLTFVAMLPWFLGLLVVMPVLGHATWHLYRAALR